MNLDVFQSDAFSLIELTHALERVPHVPSLLGQLGIFTPKPIRTVGFSVEIADGKVSLIQSSPRGAPLEHAAHNPRNIRDFRTVRLAKGDRLNASEVQGIRAFGTTSELQQVQTETLTRLSNLRRDLDLTMERHRLGAVQGIVLDANGDQLFDWHTLLGSPQAPEINFRLNDGDADVRGTIRNVLRAAIKGSQGAWMPGTRLVALCGDNFYDALVNHKQIKETKLNTERAPLLENITAYSSIEIEGVTFVNYQGTADGSSVAIGSDKVKFFPVGGAGMFDHVMSPGETFDVVNTPGLPFYALTVPDRDRNMWVDLEVYAYPAFVANRPGALQRGKKQ